MLPGGARGKKLPVSDRLSPKITRLPTRPPEGTVRSSRTSRRGTKCGRRSGLLAAVKPKRRRVERIMVTSLNKRGERLPPRGREATSRPRGGQRRVRVGVLVHQKHTTCR